MKKHMKELTSLSTDQLHKQLAELQQEITDLRRGIILGDVQNNQLYSQKRRQVARIKMLLKNPAAASGKEEAAVATKKAAKKTAAKENK